jgi:tetratricopeptide (TPR) repeat protein
MKRALLSVLAVLGACRSAPVGPYTPPTAASRNSTEAERLNRLGADVIDGNPSEAEKLLRDALTKDLYCGPAHNNLGVLYLKSGKLYEAANEFEWAKKLMPGHPDPRVNLALVLERAGKLDDARTNYESALKEYPDYLPAIQGLASLTVRSGRADEHLASWLDTIAMRSDDDTWRDWAGVQRTRVR